MTAVQAVPGTVPGVPGAHEAVPVEGSCYEKRSTWPANLKAFASYPVTAVCSTCHGRIRCAVMGGEWVHVQDDEAQG
ncbi:MAG TPA: hypothetical protein VFE59_08945 [Trebonia sp.]|nr:hypothetical protein [Trebonia sp.]